MKLDFLILNFSCQARQREITDETDFTDLHGFICF